MLSFLKSKKNTEKKEGGGLFSSITKGLRKTRESLASGLGTLFLGKKVIDQDLLDEIETQLLVADVGVDVTKAIIADLTRKVSRKELSDPEALYNSLKENLLEILRGSGSEKKLPETTDKPQVVLIIGVNGTGKTTTLGKLAHHFQNQNKKILLAAGDTFRAAAIEQIQVWGQRCQIPVIAQQGSADSASVIFDAYQAAIARQTDILLADTAGRLHTQGHLMEELKKIKRVLTKINPAAPHEILLVLDATTGQNAIRQAEQFNEAMGVTGIILTKLDGTAKGGIIFAIAKKMKLPIYFIGVGENVDDLLPFKPEEFVEALFLTENQPA
jgi:fused signal recognition particle receptor